MKVVSKSCNQRPKSRVNVRRKMALWLIFNQNPFIHVDWLSLNLSLLLWLLCYANPPKLIHYEHVSAGLGSSKYWSVISVSLQLPKIYTSAVTPSNYFAEYSLGWILQNGWRLEAAWSWLYPQPWNLENTLDYFTILRKHRENKFISRWKHIWFYPHLNPQPSAWCG